MLIKISIAELHAKVRMGSRRKTEINVLTCIHTYTYTINGAIIMQWIAANVSREIDCNRDAFLKYRCFWIVQWLIIAVAKPGAQQIKRFDLGNAFILIFDSAQDIHFFIENNVKIIFLILIQELLPQECRSVIYQLLVQISVQKRWSLEFECASTAVIFAEPIVD
jgi:hypothetical protein